MLYINPPTMTKEQWLTHNATQVDADRVRNFDFDSSLTADTFPIIWADNGGFTAAGVAPDAAERNRWFIERDPPDLRPKTYWLVKKEVFFTLHPEYRDVVEGKSE